MERLVDFKIYALSVIGFLVSISAPDKATLREEAHALQCITARPYNAIPTNLPRTGSTCGLGLDTFGIHILSLAARYRTAVNPGTFVNGLAKIPAAREHDSAPIFARICLNMDGQKNKSDNTTDHSYEATPEERRRWEKNWHIFSQRRKTRSDEATPWFL